MNETHALIYTLTSPSVRSIPQAHQQHSQGLLVLHPTHGILLNVEAAVGQTALVLLAGVCEGRGLTGPTAVEKIRETGVSARPFNHTQPRFRHTSTTHAFQAHHFFTQAGRRKHRHARNSSTPAAAVPAAPQSRTQPSWIHAREQPTVPAFEMCRFLI